MTIRKKTLLTVGLTLVSAIAVLYFSLSAILLRGFAQVEDRDARQNVQRVLNAFDSDIQLMNFTATDWAVWDDTYDFVVDGNQRYINVNLNAATEQRLNLNIMMFVKTNGQVTWGSGHDLKTGQDTPVPESFLQQVTPTSPLLNFKGTDDHVGGVVVLPQGILMVSARPILDSNGNGPSHGTLIFGHYLNDQDVKDLSTRTHFPLEFHRLNSSNLPADFQEMRSQLSAANPIALVPRSSSDMAGYALMNDINGQPALLLRVDMPRDIFDTARVSLRYLVLAVLLVGLVLALATMLLLERMVLSRLARLSSAVAHIGSQGDLSIRISLPGSDELSALAGTINQTLQALHDSVKREQALKQQVEELRIEIDEVKKAKQVAEIVDTDYFQNLARQAGEMRRRIKGSRNSTE